MAPAAPSQCRAAQCRQVGYGRDDIHDRELNPEEGANSNVYYAPQLMNAHDSSPFARVLRRVQCVQQNARRTNAY